MKRPKWESFPPFHFVPSGLDQYGLPIGSLLETNDAREKRVKAVKDMAEQIFEAAIVHLGEDGARRLFVRVAAPEKRRGRGQASARIPNLALELLSLWREAQVRGESDKSLAQRLHNDHQGKFGFGPGAIERQLRRIKNSEALRLAESEKAERRRARLRNRYRTATGFQFSPSLLSITEPEPDK